PPGAGGGGPVGTGAVSTPPGGQKTLAVPPPGGARLAVQRANAAGGLFGRTVEMVEVDGETRPEVIAERTTALFEGAPGLAGVIGLSDTDMVLAAAPVVAGQGRVFLTSGATSPLLPRQVPDYLFLAAFGDNVQAAAGAEWAFESLGARSAAVLYSGASTYARLLQGYFADRFAALGGKVLAVAAYDPGDPAAAVAALPPADLIYLAALPDEVAEAVPALRRAGIEAPILGGDGLDIGGAWAAVPETRAVYFTTHAYLGPDSPDPAVIRFREEYADAYPGREPDAFAALGYDAARLLLAAIETAGSPEPEAVRAALAATRDFAGVTGTIGYAPGSRIPAKSVAIIGVDSGRQSFVASILPREIPQPE
ncbi:ABC transporter substrate-binding protein, partial [Amaricoccus sp.]|uniref:ABC transporter substrate-binding protein n=1 Tax=Amaricoccus sp. TaxID=1872485 RepID=UPI002C779843